MVNPASPVRPVSPANPARQIQQVHLTQPTAKHLEEVAARLRPADRQELAALCGKFEPKLARQLLADCLHRSSPAFAICVGRQTLALTGAIPLTAAQAALVWQGDSTTDAITAAPWLLGTPAIAGHRLGFMRASRAALRAYCAVYARLGNAVLVGPPERPAQSGQTQNCRYLAALGFRLGPLRLLGGGWFRNFNLEV